METIENSFAGAVLLRLWFILAGWYETSGIARLIRGVSAAWTRWSHGSALMDLVVREGAFPRAWRHSFFCGLLETVVNLPAAILHWIYRRFRPVFDNSVFALLGFGMGE